MTSKTKGKYEVCIQDWKGHRTMWCDTIPEVWDAINNREFGGLYQVYDQNGEMVDEFVPY